MSDSVSGEVEHAHNKEITDYKNNLDRACINFVSGYNSLKSGSTDYLTSAVETNEFSKRRIEESASNFLPLRESQLRRLLEISYALGIPLSPVGIMTFTSAELKNLGLALTGSFKMEPLGGIYYNSTKFKSGPSSNIGLWLVHSPSAAEFTEEEFERQMVEIEEEYKNSNHTPLPSGVIRGMRAPEIPRKLFSPKREEMRDMDEFIAHEAFHGIHNSLTDNLSAFSAFDKRLLSEALALRTGLLLNTRTPEEIRNLLKNSYFDDPTSDQDVLIDKVVDIISTSMDADYQRELTWRGIYASSIQEFIEPSPGCQEFTKEMSDYAVNTVLPTFAKQLDSNRN